MEREGDKQVGDIEGGGQGHHVSPMKPVTQGAYGGGLYGTEKGQPEKPVKPPASDTQSADGPPDRPHLEPKQKPPPSYGDRDVKALRPILLSKRRIVHGHV
ncbi:hypothetical protein RJ639_020141 [Escallonia herrerae]|uniref:Uncharacterized protein n=1 Tax=Escallonia herrerae TaxID=1293975 RepID=A0AA88VC73_9ASTE|nr:hypothetical protein RJ639_020141 [Escallonia herrerae]